MIAVIEKSVASFLATDHHAVRTHIVPVLEHRGAARVFGDGLATSVANDLSAGSSSSNGVSAVHAGIYAVAGVVVAIEIVLIE
jgi:hypothetical protein